jgi:hypothetical protein
MDNLRKEMLNNEFSNGNFCSGCSAKLLQPNSLLERQYQSSARIIPEERRKVL